jgi:hypothetical protein
LEVGAVHDVVILPSTAVHVSAYFVFADIVTACVPLRALEPVQPSEAEQDTAPVLLQVRVA